MENYGALDENDRNNNNDNDGICNKFCKLFRKIFATPPIIYKGYIITDILYYIMIAFDTMYSLIFLLYYTYILFDLDMQLLNLYVILIGFIFVNIFISNVTDIILPKCLSRNFDMLIDTISYILRLTICILSITIFIINYNESIFNLVFLLYPIFHITLQIAYNICKYKCSA